MEGDIVRLSRGAVMTDILVKGANTILRVDEGLEWARYRRYLPLLRAYGHVALPTEPFNYRKYVALDAMDRCYDNAMQSAVQHGLRYVEGAVIYEVEGGGIFPLAHGWCEDGEGQIVDTTLHKQQGYVTCIYQGVRIHKEYSQKWKERVGYYGCLDGHRNGYAVGPHYEDPELWVDRG